MILLGMSISRISQMSRRILNSDPSTAVCSFIDGLERTLTLQSYQHIQGEVLHMNQILQMLLLEYCKSSGMCPFPYINTGVYPLNLVRVVLQFGVLQSC